MEQDKDILERLDVLRDVPSPDPEAWESARQAFLQEAQNLVDHPVTSDNHVRLKGWRAWLQRVRSFRLREVSMLTALKVVMVLGLIFGGSTGTVQAARQSLPETPLYPLKLQLEDWQLGAADSPEARVEKALDFAGNRVDEAVRMSAGGQDVPPEVAARYEKHVGVALQASEGISEPLRLRVRDQISETLGAQLRVMNQVMQQTQAGGNEGAAGPMQSMVQTMERAQAQFAGEAGPGPGIEAGDGEQHSYGPSDGNADSEETGGPGPGEMQGPGSEEGEPGPGEPPADDGSYGPDAGFGPGEPNEDSGQPDDSGDGGSQNGVDRHDGPGGEQPDNDNGGDNGNNNGGNGGNGSNGDGGGSGGGGKS